ncbi:monooxygenase family protein [Paenibacillus sp. S33]
MQKGRYKAEIDGESIVFIIGMRVNRLWAINKWLPVSKAMGPIRELYMNKDLGFLGIGWRGEPVQQQHVDVRPPSSEVGAVHAYVIKDKKEVYQALKRFWPKAHRAIKDMRPICGEVGPVNIV